MPRFFLENIASDEDTQTRYVLQNFGLTAASGKDDCQLYIGMREGEWPVPENVFWVQLSQTASPTAATNYLWWPSDVFRRDTLGSLQQIVRSFRLWLQARLHDDQFIFPRAYFEAVTERLQTHLRGMSGMANLLREEYLSSLQRQKYADYVSGSANRLQNFFANLWEYYQFRQHHTGLKWNVFSLDQLLDELAERYQRILVSLDKEQLELQLRYLPGWLPQTAMRSDKRRLILIVSNLLDHAVHCAEAGVIRWTAKLQGEQLLLEIRINRQLPENNPALHEPEQGLGWLVAQFNAEIIGARLEQDTQTNCICTRLWLPIQP